MLKAVFVLTFWLASKCTCDTQYGPDPWNYDGSAQLAMINSNDIPPDLRITPRRREIESENGVGKSEWFYKRILAILLKGGNVQKNSDDSMEVTIQMRFSRERWASLNVFLASNNAFNEDIYRRSVGYVEEAIVKPTMTEKIIWVWTDYVHFYFWEYQIYFTWTLGCLAAALLFRYVWAHMSHKHIILFVFIVVYLYEAFISYKEAEQQEYERFVSAVNTCRWRFWSSECNIPAPDPLVFFKHMHPLKIGMRLFTMLISEPVLALSSTVKTLIHGVTDDLWYPLNVLVFNILVIVINILLLVFLMMILFNSVLRIPFNVSFLAGLVNIGISGRRHSQTETPHSDTRHITETEDRISGANLEKLLNVCTQFAQKQVSPKKEQRTNNTRSITLHKSASTGRLSDLAISRWEDRAPLGGVRKKRWWHVNKCPDKTYAQGDQHAASNGGVSKNHKKEDKKIK